MRVLVVDDYPDCAHSTANLLRYYGHDAAAAISGEEALGRAEDAFPDVVILDLAMPGMDGYEVARRLRSSPGRRPPFIVAMTGNRRAEDWVRAFEAGVHVHLIKPVDPGDLVALLRQFQRLRADG